MTRQVDRLAIHLATEADGEADLYVHAAGAHALVLTGIAGQSLVDRTAVHIAAESDALADLRIHQMAAHSLLTTNIAGQAQIDRAAIHIAAESDASAFLRIHGASVHALIDSFVDLTAPPLIPLDQTTPLFLADWTPSVSITSSWNTAIGQSPVSYVRENVALQDRPKRQMDIEWLFSHSDLVDEDWKAKAEILYDMLRRLTGQRTLMPLYPDVVQIDGNTVLSDGILWSSTSVRMSSTGVLMSTTGGLVSGPVAFDLGNRRFHQHKPVAIFAKHRYTNTLDPFSIQYYTISEVDRDADTIEFYETTEFPDLSFLSHNWFMVPMMLVEVTAEPLLTHLNADTIRVSVQVREFPGPTALPAWVQPSEIAAVPLFQIRANYEDPVESSFQREIVSDRQGRDLVTIPLGPRYSHTQRWGTVMERDEWMEKGLTLWDGLRGRWKPLIVREQDALQGYESLATTFIQFTPQPYDFDIWQERMEEAGFLVLERSDKTQMRKQIVAVTDEGATWQIQVATSFGFTDTAGLGSSVLNVFPARRYHFGSDSIVETWITPCVVEVGFSFLEEFGADELIESEAEVPEPPPRVDPPVPPITPFPKIGGGGITFGT